MIYLRDSIPSVTPITGLNSICNPRLWESTPSCTPPEIRLAQNICTQGGGVHLEELHCSRKAHVAPQWPNLKIIGQPAILHMGWVVASQESVLESIDGFAMLARAGISCACARRIEIVRW